MWRTVVGIAIQIALAGFAVVALLIGLAWIDHTRETRLPSTSGSFKVGRIMCDWRDATTSERPFPQAGPRRQLLAWIWFPADPKHATQATAEYVPAAWRSAIRKHAGVLLSEFLTRDLARVRTTSIRNGEMALQPRMYPVVLLRAGLAAEILSYTSLAEDLASHGYVVVGFNVPYRTLVVVLPDGRAIERAAENDADRFEGAAKEQIATRLVRDWSSDMSFALDQLERLNASDTSGRFLGRLDMQSIGVFGHSLGGATSLQFCHDDARCKAGIDVDGAPLGEAVRDGIRRPFLFLLSDHTGEPIAETKPVMAKIDSIYNRLPVNGRIGIVIQGATHFGFSDDGALLKSPLFMNLLRQLGVLHLDGPRQIELTRRLVAAFFDVYLKNRPVSVLKAAAATPEVHDLY